jgi:acetylglutamate kinase
MTDGSHSDARIVDVRPIRISDELNRGNVIVIAGFQGVNPETKEITTLGRGGTDTTAVALAAKFVAARCEIIREVDGVGTADPQIVPTASEAIPAHRAIQRQSEEIVRVRGFVLNVAIWRAIPNKTMNSYIIEVIM